VPDSPTSATRASEPTKIVNACAAAAAELTATREFAEALERENHALKERAATAIRTESLLAELAESRRTENEALRTAVAAKNETILAKDAAIAQQDELIADLKRRKSSPWKRIGDVLIGVAVSAILK
jgi:hypothetical protein